MLTNAVVYGTIQDDLGRPVGNTPVEVLAHFGGCDTPFRGFMLLSTNSAGHYRGTAASLYSPFVADCFTVTVNPDSDPRWTHARLELPGRLEFRFDPRGLHLDSMRLDVITGTQPAGS